MIAVRHRQQQDQLLNARTSGVPASISTALANLMQLSPVPGKAAPGFTLTDQAGRTLSLASFRGHAVVLEFMDPHCTDISRSSRGSSSTRTATLAPPPHAWCSSP